MATDTETAEQEKPFIEVYGDLCRQRTNAVLRLRYEKDSGGPKDKIQAAQEEATRAYTNLVDLASRKVLTTPPEEREDLINQLFQTSQANSSDGFTNYLFDFDKFQDDIAEHAQKLIEEHEKQPSLV